MKIYFVSKSCKAKGPAFLKLAGDDYLEEGDICIVDTEDSTISYLLTDDQQTWSQCKLIIKVPLIVDTAWSNFLLYSYNGFDGRKGDVTALESLQFVFQTSVLSPLLEEAIRILKYEKDQIDASVIHKIYQKVLEKPIKPEKIESKDSGISSRKKNFVSFLKPDVIEKIRPMIVSGMSGKEIVAIIKNSFPLEFRQAFIEYNRYNPNGSIQEGLFEYLGKGEEQTDNFFGKNVIAHKNYSEILRNLNVNKRGDKISPHKPILLLTVMELVEKGEIVSPFIPISRELEETFKRLWEKFVPKGEGHQCSLQNPFFYMRSEGFWRLEPLPWHEEKISYSLKDLRRNYYGAIIDAELFDEFCDKSRREEFWRVLVKTYLTRLEKLEYDRKMESSRPMEFEAHTVDNAAEPSLIYMGQEGIRVEEYSEKSIAVYGNVRHLTEHFKEINGRFNPNLAGGAGWIFPMKKRHLVIDLINKKERKTYSSKVKVDTIGEVEMKSIENDLDMVYSQKTLLIISSKEKKVSKLPRRAKIISVKSKNFYISKTRNSSEMLERFVIAVGVENVYNLKIPFLDGYLVDDMPSRIFQSQYSYQPLVGGYWLNSQGSVLEKIQQMQEIACRLDLDLVIEVGK